MTSERAHPFDDAVGAMPRHELSSEVETAHLAMLARLADEEHRRGRRGLARMSRRRIAIATAGVIVLLSAGVGTSVALGLFSKPTDRRIATCFATTVLDEPDSRFDFVVAVAADSDLSEGDAAAAALEICADAWRQGRLSATAPFAREDPLPQPWDRPVPELVACVLRSGRVGVVPGSSETCADLGLSVADLRE